MSLLHLCSTKFKLNIVQKHAGDKLWGEITILCSNEGVSFGPRQGLLKIGNFYFLALRLLGGHVVPMWRASITINIIHLS